VVFRAPADGVLRRVRLDAMTAIYDRRSGATHLVSDVVPTILDALALGDADLDVLADRLETTELAALADRIDELVITGLIEAR
jgi:hypothetical protein